MRVVLSNSSYKWGGVHRITEYLARGLTSRGHDLAILTRRGSMLHERLHREFDTRAVVQGGDLNPATMWRIRRELLAFRPDVVLTLMEKDLRLTGLAARTLGLPLVARRANDEPLRAGAYSRLLYNTIATHHVANSRATKATMLSSARWLQGERITVIYNGINTAAIDRAAPADLGLEGVLVGLVARLERRKGVRDLLDAWPTVSAAAPNAQLVIAGRGALDDEVRARSKVLERVHVLGYCDDVPGLLKRLDIVAVPSHWEGFGLIAAEAMAAGKPVIAANASSLPEVVRDGIDGILVPPRDATALADAILRLIRDPKERLRLGQNGKARAADAFSVDRMVNEYERLLGNVVEEKSGARELPNAS